MERRGLLLFGLLSGIFLAAVDSTVVAVAMPSIVSSLRGLEVYSWTFAAYILTSTVAGPLWGRISDVYGRRIVYVAGVSVFLVGSALCGLSTDMIQLVVFRAIQGFGGGALLVLTFTIVGEIFTLKERARATGYTSSVWATASIIGPPLGGAIVDTVGWRWIFLINLPIGVFCLFAVLKSIKETARPSSKIDLKGSMLFLLAASSLLLFLSEFQTIGAFSPLILLMGAAALTLFLFNERKTDSPLIPFSLFKDRLLRVGFIGNLLAGFIFFGVIAYMPLYLQAVLGYTATFSGFLLLPLVLGWVMGANIASRMVVKAPLKIAAAISGFSLFAGTVLLSLLNISRDFLLAGFGLVGLGMGFTVSSFLIATQTVVPREMLGVSTSLLSFLRLIGGAVSAAVLWIPIGGLVRQYELEQNLVLTETEKALFSAGVAQAMLIVAAAAAVAMILYLLTPNTKLSQPVKKQ